MSGPVAASGFLSHLFNHANAMVVPHSVTDVSARLTSLNINKDDIKLLAKQEVDGDCLVHLSDESLHRIGVPTLGRRVRIVKAAQAIITDWQASVVLGANGGGKPSSAAVAPATPPTPKRTLAKPSVNEEHSSKTSPSSNSSSSSSSTSTTRPKTADKEKEKEREKEKDVKDKDKEVRDKEKEKEKSKSSSLTSTKENDKSSKEKSREKSNSIDIDEEDAEEADEESTSSKSKSSSTKKPTASASSANGKSSSSSKAKAVESEAEVSEVESDTEIERTFAHPRAKADPKPSKGGDDDDELFATASASHGSEFMAVKPWLGAIVAPSKPPKADPSPPESHLKLEWVHGYRSFDSRSNVVYNEAREIVYHAAAVGIVYNTKTKKQRHFLGHNDDIRCLAQHPSKPNLIVTGQNATIIKGKSAAPYVCIWDSTDFTKSWTLKLTQDDRAARSVCFNGDGKIVASVSDDDSHTVKVWDWEKKTMLASAKGDNNAIYQIKGNHRDASEFVTVGKRHAVFWNYDANKLVGKRAQIADKNLSFYSVCFSDKGYACLGGEDGAIYVYVSGKPVKTFTGLHTGKVLTLDYFGGGIVSGGADCVLNVLDKKMEVSKHIQFDDKVSAVHIDESSESLLVGTMGAELYEIKSYLEFEHARISDAELEPVTRGHSDGELWALAVSRDNRTYVTVGEDNMLAVWDVATHQCLRSARITDKKSGKKPKIARASTTSTHAANQCARAIAISPNNKQVAIGLNTGELAVYDLKSLKLVTQVDLNSFGKRQVKEQKDNWIQALSYSPSGRVLAAGTHGSVVCLCDSQEGYAVKGSAHASNSFITHLDWSADGTVLQSNDGAYELLFYSIDEDDLSRASQITHASSLRDEKWASLTCTLNWGVQGIYDASQGGFEVLSVDVNSDRELAVTGDDRGNVSLYRYPVPKGAKSIGAHAHSSHVVSTRFTPDGKYVLSTGGHDLAIMQWQVVAQ